MHEVKDLEHSACGAVLFEVTGSLDFGTRSLWGHQQYRISSSYHLFPSFLERLLQLLTRVDFGDDDSSQISHVSPFFFIRISVFSSMILTGADARTILKV